MKEKDLTERTLESYNDVFADIVNVLLFDGENIVDENDLVDVTPVSQYKMADRMHQQERDVAKVWTKKGVRFCFYGFENQTRVDGDMALRIIGYDGADYRGQLLAKGKRERYPVVTMVLYFGQGHWKKRNLLSRLEIPEELKQYVSDYRINVFEIAWLTPEQVRLFKSDFRIVADYFVQKRINREYSPSRDTIRHVDEILKIMSVLSGDRKYEAVQKEYHKYKSEGEVNMAGLFTQWKNEGYNEGMSQGFAQGINKGINQGINQGIAMTVKNLLKFKTCTMEQISQATGLSIEEVQKLNEEIEA